MCDNLYLLCIYYCGFCLLLVGLYLIYRGWPVVPRAIAYLKRKLLIMKVYRTLKAIEKRRNRYYG